MIAVKTLMSEESLLVPVEVAKCWKVYSKYADMHDGPVEEFFFPPQVDSVEKIRLLVAFTQQHVDCKISHVRAPLYQPQDLTKDPFGVPAWAVDWAYSLDLDALFDMLQVGEAVQFAALTELCAAMLANVFCCMSKNERTSLQSIGLEMKKAKTGSDKEIDDQEKKVFELGDDYVISYE